MPTVWVEEEDDDDDEEEEEKWNWSVWVVDNGVSHWIFIFLVPRMQV